MTGAPYPPACCAADPYLNVDAGTMSPFEHGEVFVLDDGGEVREGTRTFCRSAGVGWNGVHVCA